jgi:hypothetical protein
MGIEQAELLVEKGFDYIECAVNSLPLEDDQALAVKLPILMNSPLKVLAMNNFIPGSMKVVGPEADRERIIRYIHRTGEIAHRIGPKS